MACGGGKRYILVIAQTAWEKPRHERADFEADTEPLARCRAINGSGLGFWSTEREETLPSQPRNGHLEIVRGNREKTVRTFAAATPDFFDQRMIRISVLEMDELALTLRRVVRTRLGGHSQPSSPHWPSPCSVPMDCGLAWIEAGAQRGQARSFR